MSLDSVRGSGCVTAAITRSDAIEYFPLETSKLMLYQFLNTVERDLVSRLHVALTFADTLI